MEGQRLGQGGERRVRTAEMPPVASDIAAKQVRAVVRIHYGLGRTQIWRGVVIWN